MFFTLNFIIVMLIVLFQERAQSLKGKSKDPNGNHKPKSATRKSSSSKVIKNCNEMLNDFDRKRSGSHQK